MGFVLTTGNRHVVQKCSLDRQKLEQIADVLGIAQADRDDLLYGGVSIHIYAGARPAVSGAPPAPGTPPTQGTPSTPSGGGRP